jgi:multidrug efflux pump subunit AcrA (membrane-fusion protein)
MQMKKFGVLAAAAAAAVVVAFGAAGQDGSTGEAASASAGADEATWNEVSDAFGGAKAATKPSRDVTMAFTFPTEVRELSVHGGERVKQGDVLVRARDADVTAALEQQRVRSGSRLSIELAEKQQELADIRYAKIMEVGESGSSQMEREERRVEKEAAALQLQQAIMSFDEEQYKLAQLEGSYERYRLEAPFDGIVEDVMIEVGQAVRETDPAVRIVNTDVLELEANATTDTTIRLQLKPGAPAWVLMDLGGRPVLAVGKVKYVSPVANSVSRTQRVNVELENPAGWPAGMQAQVVFEEPGAAFAKYQWDGGAAETAQSARSGE